jgi:hypothetical protein
MTDDERRLLCQFCDFLRERGLAICGPGRLRSGPPGWWVIGGPDEEIPAAPRLYAPAGGWDALVEEFADYRRVRGEQAE